MADDFTEVAIIGLGSWGSRAHLPAFAALADVRIGAIVSSRANDARDVAAQYGITRIEADAEALFRDPGGVQAAVIATPDDTHRDLTLGAFASGLDVLCEKPLAYDVPAAEQMVDAAREGDRVGRVGFLFRHSPGLRKMKELVDAGQIGEVQLFESININGQFHDPGMPLHWKMQRSRANGGVFVEYGAHSIDLAHWLCGSIRQVVAHGVTQIDRRTTNEGESVQVDSDDACSWIATFDSGGQGLFRVGWASLPVGGSGLRLYGSHGSLAWQLDSTTRRSEVLRIATASEPEPREVLRFDAHSGSPPFGNGNSLGLLAHYNAGLARSFVNDVRSRQTSAPDFGDGLRAQRVLRAIRDSLDQHRWVDVEDGGEASSA